MKKIIFILLVSSVSVVFAKNATKRNPNAEETEKVCATELCNKFLADTKIELGVYERAPDSPESCLDGELVLRDVSEGSVSELNLMLGARSLAGSLGREKYAEKEDGCENTYETTYNDVAIKARTEQVCSGFKKIYHTTVNLSKGKLAYVQEVYEEDKLVDTQKCTVIKKDVTPAVAAPIEAKKEIAKPKFKKAPATKKK